MFAKNEPNALKDKRDQIDRNMKLGKLNPEIGNRQKVNIHSSFNVVSIIIGHIYIYFLFFFLVGSVDRVETSRLRIVRQRQNVCTRRDEQTSWQHVVQWFQYTRLIKRIRYEHFIIATVIETYTTNVLDWLRLLCMINVHFEKTKNYR